MTTDIFFTPSQNHWRAAIGMYKERVTGPQLQQVLLHQPMPIVHGMLCEWKHKHIGVGVYELWVESKDPFK